jgi:hypothetical protein
MGILHTATVKELLEIRNKIVLETAIPCLLQQGFTKSPFSTATNGRNNLGDFAYELCRLKANTRLEIVTIYLARDDRWIKFHLNIFQLNPKIESIEQLKGVDGLQFKLPPNSLTDMRLRSDDITGIPLLRLRYMGGHKLRPFYTRAGMVQNLQRLKAIVTKDMKGIERFVNRWYELHQPILTSWTGHKIEQETR